MHAEIIRGLALNVASCDARSVLRIAMCLANRIAHPITGMFRISAFEMYLDEGSRRVYAQQRNSTVHARHLT